MLREKIKKKVLVFPILTTIIIGFIAVFSNQEIVMNFARHIDSGECDGSLYWIERQATYTIEWEFTSTSDVALLIIKKSTFQDLQRIVSENPPPASEDYYDLLACFLEDYYVSRGNQTDSGKFYVNSSGIHMIWFKTSGIINYCVKFDPYSTDLSGVFYICLGVTTTIGIILSISKFKKLIKMKPISEKEIIKCGNNQIKVSCERCGADIDSDSIFCHECGIKIKDINLRRID